MRALTIDDLRTLIAHDGAPCISIYLPTHRGGGPDDKQRYAGLVRSARDQLATEYSSSKIEALCGPLDARVKDELWSHTLEGLAIFRSKDVDAYYRLPIDVGELCVVADSFHIRPLLRFLQSNERYFLLNLSQGRTSFFKGSAHGLGAIDLATMPRSLAEAIGVETRERALTSHAGSGGRSQAPIFHGNGREETARDEELNQFLRAIDRALWEVLRDETAPLVVASTPKVAAAYQSISRYPHLLHEHVAGSFAHASLGELHARAWPLVQRHAETRLADASQRYGNMIPRERALDDLATIARYAVQGRVRDLLVDREARLWGRMDRATGAIDLHGAQVDAHDDDVIDDVAEAVILRGGDVLTLPRKDMPSKSPVAATLRW